jgi:DNA-binding NtrC family response regulator
MSNAALRGKRVLIVDDEHTIADTLAIIFSSEGYETKAVYSAEAAVLVVSGWCPDLAIIDMIMVDMNGINCAIRVVGACPECRILLTSGAIHPFRFVEEARSQGYNFDLVGKPIHPLKMLSKAEALLLGATDDD